LVAEALKTNSILTTLNLEGNKIGPADATALAGALKTNMTLASLRLEANRIGDDGARALADALKTNKTLAELVLYFNGIGEAGGTSLAEALNNNTTLTALHVYRGSREKWIKEIDVKLERNRLQPQMAGAAVALEVASDRQYPPEIMQLIVQQLIVLPPKLKEDGRDTVRELSKWVAYPPRKP
jgi:Ran GTPase-activating protein (RanGAP) involved in mRNA processing and transport